MKAYFELSNKDGVPVGCTDQTIEAPVSEHAKMENYVLSAWNSQPHLHQNSYATKCNYKISHEQSNKVLKGYKHVVVFTFKKYQTRLV